MTDAADPAEQQVWIRPREYEIGGRSWQSEAISDLSRAIHPVLGAMSREAVHDLPNAEERPSSDSGAGARLYRGLQVRHESTWNAEDIVAFNLESYLSLLWETADSIGGQMVRGMFEHISEVADEHGQVIKANGRDVYELLIEATEKMDVQFDEDGNPGERILAINPETYAQVKGDGPTPDQEERMRVVMERKREEWRASRRRRELP